MTSIRAGIITRRTYCRPKNDEGTEFETWEEVVDRVIKHQRWLWERALTANVLQGVPLHDITEDLEEWVHLNEEQEAELEELRQLFLERKALPSGRTLWLGGTEISKRREASMFNCSFLKIETIYDVVDAFWLLLQGCGVGVYPVKGTLNGFRKPIKDIEIIRSTKKKGDPKGRENNEEDFIDGVWTISIGDSAEAWAKAIGKLIAGKYKADKLVIDLREIRAAGERLKGYGWISSGDESLYKALLGICEIMNRRAGNLLSKLDILEVMNYLGTVLSSRRSAEIAFVDYGEDEWYEFANFKENCFVDGFKHRQQSNNSLLFNSKPSREELLNIFDMMIAAGGSEPGFYNAQTAKKRAPWFAGSNPCGEILLSNKSFCNLSEIDVGKFVGDSAGLHKAAVLIGRANYRQTVVDFRDGILQEAWHKNNEFMRLCGVGITGIAKRDDMTEYDWRELRYSAVFGARSMAKELGLQHPKNITTVKPSGCREGRGLLTTREGLFMLEELMHKEKQPWATAKNILVIQDDKINKVTKTFKNGISETVTIKLSYGMEIVCTPDHKWFVSSKKQWVRADELIIDRDYIDIKLGIFNENNIVELKQIDNTQPKLLTEDIAWLLGYMWGDSRLRFIDQYKYNLEKVQTILKTYFNLNSDIQNSILEIENTNLYRWFIENGFNKCGSIPEKVRRAKNLILAFVAGLIDSSGSIHKDDKNYRFTISTTQDAKHLQDVCWAVGIGVALNNYQYLTNIAEYTDPISFEVLRKNSNKIGNCDPDIPWNFETCKRVSAHAGKVKDVSYNKELIETFDVEVDNNHWYYAGALKSHNTLGKIMDTTEGVHKPEGKYLFNWVNFSQHDPIVDKLKIANYNWMVNPTDPTSVLVCLPVKYDNVHFSRKEVTRKDGTKEVLEVNLESAIEQLERYKKIQVNYCDQNVSNTIYYKPEEKEEIVDWLLENWDIYVGVSFLFKNDPTVSAEDLGFNYLPQEYVTEEKYEEYMAQLKPIDWSNTDADIEYEDEGCATGACPIK